LDWQRFIAVLTAVRDRLPGTVVHVLTKGRAFLADEVASALRVVLHAVTAPRLRETCAWLARNLPFVATRCPFSLSRKIPSTVEADEIAVAKMPEAGPKPYRDGETLAFAGREMLIEENGRLESVRLRGRKTLLVTDQGAIPLIQFNRA
jgi:hypothetical protein